MPGQPPIDPDLDPGAGSGRVGDVSLLAAISLGGVVGAVARYETGLHWTTATGHLPLATLVINTTGCAAIGVLMVLVSDVFTGQRLLRPFLGTGVLGGFTTFSTYAVDSQRLLVTDHVWIAVTNLALTVVAALSAVLAASRFTRRLLQLRRPARTWQ